MNRQLEVRTVVDALVTDLRARILGGQVPGGTALAENDLATEYAVARPTARTAIERLVAERLLTRGVHRSARVPVLDADDVADLYLARACVEESAAGWLAARGTVPEAATDAAAAMVQAADGGRIAEFVDLDIAFHRALVDAVGSPRLSRAHRPLLAETRLCMAQVQVHDLLAPAEILAEHDLIAATAAAGDSHGARSAASDHLMRARGVLVAHLQEAVAP